MKISRFQTAALFSAALCGLTVALYMPSVQACAQKARGQTAKQANRSAGKYVLRTAIELHPVLQKVGKEWVKVHPRLELVVDARVKPDMTDADTFDFLPAKLRLLREDGMVVQEKTLERSRAMLKMAPSLYGKGLHPTYLLTVDYSANMGSYNGPVTFLVELAGDGFRFVNANGKPISLMRSLKTDWKFVPARSGDGKTTDITDILEVACRPNTSAKLNDDDTDNDFVVIYRRFHFDGRGWTKREKSRLGFWEDDGKFPPVSRFPAPVF